MCAAVDGNLIYSALPSVVDIPLPDLAMDAPSVSFVGISVGRFGVWDQLVPVSLSLPW